MTVKFNDRAFVASLQSKIAARAEREGAAMADDVRRTIGRQHDGSRPSGPGEPPAKRSGELASSVYHEVRRDGEDVVLRVGAAAPYAYELEVGSSKVAARPYLRTVFIRRRAGLAAAIRDLV